ncbi:hypothetical protein JOF55_000169 [Haloactinomyces albus]|uniref:Uncharacterized protein n=1 Tax=Haloactinomyces albus TaxID=1352928 RepID=A0AAE3Z7Y5_9ACTN|nr:hypothetical protein [Haloactinomyces albus]
MKLRAATRSSGPLFAGSAVGYSGRDHFVSGGLMGKKARIGLLLGATSCLLAVMVDWIVEEL